ncbi:Uncharacterized protein HZ326_31403 [Fusarium oxysporum f. sp. albedinis]|nr:Uncharacterized protein HZ326_31403 [Fusarium oxysporum f. sp. albedinis]
MNFGTPLHDGHYCSKLLNEIESSRVMNHYLYQFFNTYQTQDRLFLGVSDFGIMSTRLFICSAGGSVSIDLCQRVRLSCRFLVQSSLTERLSTTKNSHFKRIN